MQYDIPRRTTLGVLFAAVAIPLLVTSSVAASAPALLDARSSPTTATRVEWQFQDMGRGSTPEPGRRLSPRAVAGLPVPGSPARPVRAIFGA